MCGTCGTQMEDHEQDVMGSINGAEVPMHISQPRCPNCGRQDANVTIGKVAGAGAKPIPVG